MASIVQNLLSDAGMESNIYANEQGFQPVTWLPPPQYSKHTV